MGRFVWLNAVAARHLLPVWFALFALWFFWVIVGTGVGGIDARIYHRGVVAWVEGADPWAAGYVLPNGEPAHFAGLPLTLIVLGWAALIPEDAFVVGMFGLCIAASVWVVYRLRLPWWWVLFPPLVHGTVSANPGVIVVALLLLPGNWSVVATGLKVYAVLPMLGEARWRQLAALAVFIGITLIAFSDLWLEWLTRAPALSTRLAREANGGTGATADLLLYPPTLFAIAVLLVFDRKAAGWLVVPSLWPSAQFHYGVMALPVIRLLPAVLLSVPMHGLPAVAVMLHAWLTVRDVAARRRSRAGVSRTVPNGRAGLHGRHRRNAHATDHLTE
jgi:hypothetical protein